MYSRRKKKKREAVLHFIKQLVSNFLFIKFLFSLLLCILVVIYCNLERREKNAFFSSSRIWNIVYTHVPIKVNEILLSIWYSYILNNVCVCARASTEIMKLSTLSKRHIFLFLCHKSGTYPWVNHHLALI